MHVDARKIDNLSLIEGDICIVGAGAAGISIALGLADSGLRVILLEGGGFEYDERVQDLYRGTLSGQPYYPLKSSRLHYFGGTTGHWGGMCSLFDPVIFGPRPWAGLEGWPFGQDELMPYYRKAHDYLDLGEFQFDAEYWITQNPALTPLPLDEKVFWNKIWRFGMPSAARFGTKFREPVDRARNISLYTYANVTDIRLNESCSKVTELEVKNHNGTQQRVKASCFVLACCAIQNARLLLNSDKQCKTGIGNDYDLVGRHFMEHAEIRSAELWLREPDALLLYQRTPPNIRAELALSPAVQQESRILNGTLSLNPLERARKKTPYIKSWNQDDPRRAREKVAQIDEKASRRSRMDRIFGSDEYSSFEITLRLEQAPNPLSRVTLLAERDELGMRRAHLHWAFTELDAHSMRTIYRLLGHHAGKAGIGRVKLNDELADPHFTGMPATTSGGWHHMGTTKMNDDPRKGVVDANCKVHGIGNLFIAGSSCFPNGAAVNPTYSIVALSLRLADHLRQFMKNERPFA